ncbi:glycerophosphodiester phosphodiesterase family protein [Hyphococcus lacteus]|uniref:Glycerophosphodiester phosphodiesterase family protein n=1 Tax=Hyphococcus lacteus TaxID=3143536 RepID=A0ABV3Z5G6_9PROT
MLIQSRWIAVAFLVTLTGCMGSKEASKIGWNTVCRSDAVINSIRDDRNGRILVTAHRAAHDSAPENSIASIERAIELGVDIVELDVRLSKDGVPVLMHDATMDRTTSGTGIVKDKTLSAIKTLRLRMADGALTDEKIPTLAEALSAARGKIAINVDLKSIDIAPIAKVIHESGAASGVFFYNSKMSVLDEVRTYLPEAVVQPIGSTADEVLMLAKQNQLELIHLRENYASQELSDALDEIGVSGYINALGLADQMLGWGDDRLVRALIETQPDVIQTDEPEALIAILEELKLRKSLPRACG